MDNIQKITTKVLIVRDGKILFLRDQKGKWELPGGKINFGESPQNTLRRELAEELECKDIQIGKIFDAWAFTVSKESYDCQYIVLMYECYTTDKRFHISSEHTAMEWFHPSEIGDLNVREGYKKSIKNYFENKINFKNG